MYRTVSKLVLALLAAPFATAQAQQPAVTGAITSSEIAISRERAEIKLEMADGRKLTFATATGAAPMQRIGGAGGDETLVLGVKRGDAVDRSWRDLLNAAMEADATMLGGLLRDWRSPDAAGSSFDAAVDAALGGLSSPVLPAAVAPGMNDSVVRLESKIQQLEEELKAREAAAENRKTRTRSGPDWLAP